MAANADKKQQHQWKTEAANQRDPIAQAHVNLWAEVCSRATWEAKAKRRRNFKGRPILNSDGISAYRFFCSEHFTTIATLLGINAELARNRLVPKAFQKEYADKLAQPIQPRTETPDSPPVRQSYYHRHKAKLAALVAAQKAAQMPVPESTGRTAASPSIGEAHPLTHLRIVDWNAMPLELAEESLPMLIDSIGLERYEEYGERLFLIAESGHLTPTMNGVQQHERL